jgi:two-component system, NtrC family, response regulator PilR
VIELPLPPLRERADDIPPLAAHILARLAAAQQRPCPHLTAAAVAALQAYPFPGNVWELENILERALTLGEAEVIEVRDLYLPAAEEMSQIPVEPRLLENRLEEVEREAILQALSRTRYNKTAAAKLLGITFRALRYRLKKLELE